MDPPCATRTRRASIVISLPRKACPPRPALPDHAPPTKDQRCLSAHPVLRHLLSAGKADFPGDAAHSEWRQERVSSLTTTKLSFRTFEVITSRVLNVLEPSRGSRTRRKSFSGARTPGDYRGTVFMRRGKKERGGVRGGTWGLWFPLVRFAHTGPLPVCASLEWMEVFTDEPLHSFVRRCSGNHRSKFPRTPPSFLPS